MIEHEMTILSLNATSARTFDHPSVEGHFPFLSLLPCIRYHVIELNLRSVQRCRERQSDVVKITCNATSRIHTHLPIKSYAIIS